MRQRKAGPKIQADFAYLPDVSVTCSISEIVVRVKPRFYGLGADAEELKLGSSCKSNGLLRPYGDLLFTYPLTACDAMRELPHGYIVYKFVLHYEPSQKRFPRKAHRIHVDIECRYQRNHHVYQLAVKPTWQTPVLGKRLKGRPSEFRIDLMDDLWSAIAESRVYHIGKPVNFQVSAPHLSNEGKLYISSCYAESSNGIISSLKYTIIDNFGYVRYSNCILPLLSFVINSGHCHIFVTHSCMVDSKSDPGASQFISRTDNSLRFSLKAFQFTADPDTEISIYCKLSVTSDDPGPTHKSCTYRGNRWKALTGDDSICECCDSQCVTSKSRRAVIEGSASSRSLFVSDQSYTAKDVSMTKKDDLINNYTKMHSRKNLWESAYEVKYDGKREQGYMEEMLGEDEESRVTIGAMTGTDFDKLGFKDGVLVEEQKASEVSTNQFGEDVLESKGKEMSNGWEGEISDAGVMHLNQKNSEGFNQRVQSENLKPSQLHDSKREEERSKYTVRREEDERASEMEWKNDDLASVAEEREMTWYFTWR
ncbi:zona pellucida sperm-binding protein 3-like isoform X2 [Channa argus]|uniref:zona pellucida sperm-binding protein 3-like isoform X2 n=1 Tax=Channa argus TaxID=215402 RepID=UPI003522121C